MSTRYEGYGASVCGDCKNSVGFCSWSGKLKPVPGAKMKKVIHKDKGGRIGYRVLSCPHFEEDVREKGERAFKYGKWSKAERDFLIKTMGKKSLEKIASHLGRSYDSVKMMATKVRAEKCVKS